MAWIMEVNVFFDGMLREGSQRRIMYFVRNLKKEMWTRLITSDILESLVLFKSIQFNVYCRLWDKLERSSFDSYGLQLKDKLHIFPDFRPKRS